MNTLRIINRYLGFLPAIPVSCFLLMIGIGFILFGEVPVYGKHPDPFSLNLSWLSLIALLFTFVCFFTIPASIVLTMHLILNNVKLKGADIISLTTSIMAIGIFLFLKQESDVFNWITD